MGACAISGGPFKQGYNVLKGIDRYIPVDVHIPPVARPPRSAVACLYHAPTQDRRADFFRARDAHGTWTQTPRANFLFRNTGRKTWSPRETQMFGTPPVLVREA
jgi:NADH:ubiquinone oxidoreductase subunit B-like Fe-S oxidoreductase